MAKNHNPLIESISDVEGNHFVPQEKFKDSIKRAKILPISVEAFLYFIQKLLSAQKSCEEVSSDTMPDDATCCGFEYNADTELILIKVQSKEFEQVPEGGSYSRLIPIFSDNIDKLLEGLHGRKKPSALPNKDEV